MGFLRRSHTSKEYLMPQTTWRPYPFDKPIDQLNNAARQRQRVIDLLRMADKPMTLQEIALRLEIGRKYYYGKARRYVLPVANPTHEIHVHKHKTEIGWTLKEEYR
jgi:hypothetical protein